MTFRMHKSENRGKANHGWLDTRHSFSFARWYNPDHMGIGPLRVLNQDIIIGGSGFPSHRHHNMDIVSIVLEGALEHQDSEGNVAVIRPGEVQRMSAGSGVSHSEKNHYKDKKTEFLQIWVLPDKENIAPSYEQIQLKPTVSDRGELPILASPRGVSGGVSLHQDAYIYGGNITMGVNTTHVIKKSRLGYFHIPKGSCYVGEMLIEEGDGLYITGPETLIFTAKTDGYILLFDLIDQ